jgi:hypothetical protein
LNRRKPARPLRWVALLPILALSLLAGCATPNAPASKALPPMEAGATGHIVIGPYVQPGGPDLTKSLQMVWWSDAPGAGLLEWREAEGNSGGDVPSVQETYEGLVRHTARVERPPDGKEALRVQASVTVNGKKFTSPRLPVRYLPGPGKILRFAALGDTGAGTPAEQRIVHQVEKHDVQMLLLTGDDVYGQGDWEEYQKRFFPYYKSFMAAVPILPALGNHDVGNPKHMGQPFRMAWTPPMNWTAPKNPPKPYSLNWRRSNKTEGPVPAGQDSLRNYSADAGACHFICLDSTADRDTIRDHILPWLKADLAAAKKRGATWLIAYWHHPPYTHGPYMDNSNQFQDIRDLFLPVLKAAGVQLILNGHDHGYQHMKKDGVDYIVTGGGGAKLYKIDPDYVGNDQPPLLGWNDKDHSFTLFEQSPDGKTLSVRQIDEYGKEIDAFQMAAR